jgi:hypothetical protein
MLPEILVLAAQLVVDVVTLVQGLVLGVIAAVHDLERSDMHAC